MPGLITPIGVGTAALHPKQASAGLPLDPLVAPGDTNPPIIFEPPPALTGGDTEVWIIATGGAEWGGCQIWVSTDGNTYAFAGTIYKGGRQGLLAAALPGHADPDTADTLSVDLTQSQGQLLSGTTADADAFVTLSYCDGELLSFAAATLTAPYKYNIASPICAAACTAPPLARIRAAPVSPASGRTTRPCSNTSIPQALSARPSM